MGITNAKFDGTCGNPKCKARFKVGEKICVEKGKQPLCAKCAPADAKEFKNFPAKPVKTFWQECFVAIISVMDTRDKTTGDAAKMAAAFADASVKELEKRGMK